MNENSQCLFFGCWIDLPNLRNEKGNGGDEAGLSFCINIFEGRDKKLGDEWEQWVTWSQAVGLTTGRGRRTRRVLVRRETMDGVISEGCFEERSLRNSKRSVESCVIMTERDEESEVVGRDSAEKDRENEREDEEYVERDVSLCDKRRKKWRRNDRNDCEMIVWLRSVVRRDDREGRKSSCWRKSKWPSFRGIDNACKN